MNPSRAWTLSGIPAAAGPELSVSIAGSDGATTPSQRPSTDNVEVTNPIQFTGIKVQGTGLKQVATPTITLGVASSGVGGPVASRLSDGAGHPGVAVRMFLFDMGRRVEFVRGRERYLWDGDRIDSTSASRGRVQGVRAVDRLRKSRTPGRACRV